MDGTPQRRVLGVVGGSGGVGASAFAAVLAAACAPSILLDLDPASGGIDVLLGIERAAGTRWSGLRVAGGQLDLAALTGGLPRWGACSVLAADTARLDAGAVLEVLEAAAPACPVVVDLPRTDSPARAAALLHCDLAVVLARGDIAGVVAAHAVHAALPELPAGVVVRRGAVPPQHVADLVGAPLLGELPALRAAAGRLDPHRLPRPLVRVAAGVLAGLERPRRRVAVPA